MTGSYPHLSLPYTEDVRTKVCSLTHKLGPGPGAKSSSLLESFWPNSLTFALTFVIKVAKAKPTIVKSAVELQRATRSEGILQRMS